MAAGKSTRSGRTLKKNQPQAMERKMPQSPEAEVALLGSLFFDPSVIGVAAEIITPDDFYVPSNRIVAQVIWDLWNDNKSIDPTIVLEELRKRKEETTAGGQEGLVRLADAVPEASHAGYYARIVREKSVLRKLISSCQEIISDSYDASEELDTLLDRSESAIYAIAHGSTQDSAYHISTLLKEAIQAIDERGHAEGLITGVDTGYGDLNELTAGFQRGELLVLAARPSVGKSTFALNLMDKISAVDNGKPVALFSLEMSAQQIARNMLCSHAQIDAHRLRTGYLEAKHYGRIMPAVGRLSEAKIYIDDTSSLTPFLLKARARRLKAKYDIELIVVDYLQLMDSQRAENRQLEIAYISRQLKGLAKELDVAVLAISQLSRAVEQREGKRPRLSDLRESGAIEQDADVVMFLHRPDYQEQAVVHGRPSETELIIAKQRNGPTGTVDLLFFKETLRFETRSRDRVPAEYSEEIAAQES